MAMLKGDARGAYAFTHLGAIPLACSICYVEQVDGAVKRCPVGADCGDRRVRCDGCLEDHLRLRHSLRMDTAQIDALTDAEAEEEGEAQSALIHSLLSQIEALKGTSCEACKNARSVRRTIASEEDLKERQARREDAVLNILDGLGGEADLRTVAIHARKSTSWVLGVFGALIEKGFVEDTGKRVRQAIIYRLR